MNNSPSQLCEAGMVLPRRSGVYQIRCLPNGKIYIGSTIDLRARWLSHRWRLRRGSHWNIYLQQAWNKYGEAHFEFAVLEYASATKLLRAEQSWLDKTGCVNRKLGFNISRIATSTGEMSAQLWEGFIDPDGNPVTIVNLHGFCRQHELDFPSMHRLAHGKSKLKSYKGWTHRNSIRQRDYMKTYAGFISPAGGLVEPITNLAAFCREHGLDNTHMVAVAHGRICSHRGWTHIKGKQKLGPKIYAGFINPDGRRAIIANLKAFCREHGLCVAHMFEVKSGKRKRHKGWTWRANNEQAGTRT